MIMSLRRMVGMPVVWQNRQVGCVEHALADPKAQELRGVVIRKGIGSAKWCPAESIERIDEECVVVARPPVRHQPQAVPSSGRAHMVNGQWIGEVTDAILRPGTLALAAVEVSPGPVHRLMGRCAYACDFRRDEKTGCMIIPSLLSWTQLTRQLGEEEKE